MKSPLMIMLAVAAVFTLTAHTCSSAPPDEKTQNTTAPGKSGYLGVSIQDMTPRLARTMEVKTEEGALVSEVLDESPAEKAGLKDDDIIVAYDGSKIADADALRAAVRKTKPGTSVSLTVIRNDETKKITAEIGKTPRSMTMVVPHTAGRAAGHAFSLFGGNSSMMGVRLRELTEQLGEYFQAPNGRGVLVEEVEKESAGAKAGLKAGDVLTAIGGSSVEDMRDVRRALRDRDEGEKVDLTVLRRGTKQSLTVTIEESDDSFEYFLEAPKVRKKLRLYWDGRDKLDKELQQLKLEIEQLDHDL